MKNNNDFVDASAPRYQYKIGKHVATSLSGFIAGAIAASVVWFAAAYFVITFVWR